MDRMDVDDARDLPSLLKICPASSSELESINKMVENLLHYLDPENLSQEDYPKCLGSISTVLTALCSVLRLKCSSHRFPQVDQVAGRFHGMRFDKEKVKELKTLAMDGLKSKKWDTMLRHTIFALATNQPAVNFSKDMHLHIQEALSDAYASNFLGEIDLDFLEHIKKLDYKVHQEQERTHAYAKAISVVQSSGTGKSRMLTEVGNWTYTLPICLRNPDAPGFPPSDTSVYRYLTEHTQRADFDLDVTAHATLASFLGAAHATMLSWLCKEKNARNLNSDELHSYWHGIMESKGSRTERVRFFDEVVTLARSLRLAGLAGLPPSPKRGSDGKPTDDPQKYAKTIYDHYVREATEKLMEFLSTVSIGCPICITYIDGAYSLELGFWVLLRLLSIQDKSIKMWYVFIGTKSSISFYTPATKGLRSLRWRNEFATLLPPYIALGFDLHAIFRPRVLNEVHVDELQTIEHLANYGRPLWRAQLSHSSSQEMISLASVKLLNSTLFTGSIDQVFAVLSQRLCLEPVLANSEAVTIADRSVSHHMRLLTGYSPEHQVFYTHTTSEPILALAASRILYREADMLKHAIKTLSDNLCSAGLVEKGLVGELGARLLLLVARDYSVKISDVPDVLQFSRVSDFMRQLFGNATWAGPDRERFNDAFDDVYVNFTHWHVTRDPLPEQPDRKLLANLWARGAALQCSFRQESLDCMIVTYHGSITPGSYFDPTKLSVIISQIKYRGQAGTKAESSLRPTGIPRDIARPPPYLALLLDLGAESTYKDGSYIKVTVPSNPVNGNFRQLQEDWYDSVRKYETMKGEKGKKADETVEMKNQVKQKRFEMDSFNRYSVSIQGRTSSVYGILKNAEIEKEFIGLLEVTMPQPLASDYLLQRLSPLERLGSDSSHNDWMYECD